MWKKLFKGFFNWKSGFSQNFPSRKNLPLLRVNLDQYEEVSGILQHHDAVSGTAKQTVTQNYINMLLCATNDINEVLSAAVGAFSQELFGEELVHEECSKGKTTQESTAVYDILANSQDVLLTVYNPSVNTQRLLQIKVPRLTLKGT